MIIAAMAVFLSSAVWAKAPQGVGKGEGGKKGAQKVSQVSEPSATERVGDEIADSIADVLTGEEKVSQTIVTKTTVSGEKGLPPGLSKKESLPAGLEKKDTTPEGWSEGQKVGWGDKTEIKEIAAEKTKESPIRRFIKNIFSRASQEE